MSIFGVASKQNSRSEFIELGISIYGNCPYVSPRHNVIRWRPGGEGNDSNMFDDE